MPITTESTVNTSTINVNPPDPYKDFSGVDTESFIMTTLRNNPKDRALLLRLELLFQQFIKNEEQTSYQFQAMNSCRNISLGFILSSCFSFLPQ